MGHHTSMCLFQRCKGNQKVSICKYFAEKSKEKPGKSPARTKKPPPLQETARQRSLAIQPSSRKMRSSRSSRGTGRGIGFKIGILVLCSSMAGPPVYDGPIVGQTAPLHINICGDGEDMCTWAYTGQKKFYGAAGNLILDTVKKL